MAGLPSLLASAKLKPGPPLSSPDVARARGPFLLVAEGLRGGDRCCTGRGLRRRQRRHRLHCVESGRRGAANDGDAAGSVASPRRLGWANLLARVFAVDVTVCRKCGGRMRILDVIRDPDDLSASTPLFGGSWHR